MIHILIPPYQLQPLSHIQSCCPHHHGLRWGIVHALSRLKPYCIHLQPSVTWAACQKWGNFQIFGRGCFTKVQSLTTYMKSQFQHLPTTTTNRACQRVTFPKVCRDTASLRMYVRLCVCRRFVRNCSGWVNPMQLAEEPICQRYSVLGWERIYNMMWCVWDRVHRVKMTQSVRRNAGNSRMCLGSPSCQRSQTLHSVQYLSVALLFSTPLA